MLRGFPASPAQVFTCSPHVRAFTLPRALRLLCLLCGGLVSVGACCCEMFFLCRGLHGAFVLLLSAPTCSGPCAVVWNWHPSLFLLGHTLAPLRACADRTKHVQRRVRSLFANIPIARPFWRVLSSSEPCPTGFRRVSVVAVAPLRLLQAPLLSRRPCHESVFPLRLLTWPSASLARHRLSVTFEMLGLCCCSDAMSSSSWILSFAPSSQQLLVHDLSLCTARHCWCLSSTSCQCSSLAKIMRPTSLKSAPFFIRCTLRQ